MAKTKVLITVKTYPTLSKKYDELVCTAGFREDGSWIRIYPIPFRKLDYASQYKKYNWIELDLEKNPKDFRPESFRPRDIDADIKILGRLDTEDNWKARKEIVLKRPVWTNMTKLIESAKNPNEHTSLAVFKPKEVIDFMVENDSREWDTKKLKYVLAHQQEQNLFEETKKIFNVARKLPYKFSYKFTSDDGKIRTLMVEDWELGMLYWNTLKRSRGDETMACQKVRQKYFDEFIKKDLYLFLGTSLKYHNLSKNPFMVIGTFYPPAASPVEPTLFFLTYNEKIPSEMAGSFW